MPEGRRPPPGACEKPRAGTFAVARGKRRSAGERACEWRTRQECGQSVRGRTGKRRSTGSGSAMGKRGKSADEPFSVARGSAGRRGRGACEWQRYGKCAGKAVFSRAGKRRSARERGLRMADAARGWASRFRSRGGSAGRRGWVCKWVDGARVRMSRSRSRPGSVTAIGIVGKTGSANAGKGMRGGQGKPLPGSGLCGGRGWGKNAWAGALRLRDRKNRAHEGCPPTVPHI